MVTGALHKPIIEEVYLMIRQVLQGLGMLLGVMAEGGIWSSHH